MVVDLRRIRKYIFIILIIFIGVVGLIVFTNNKNDNIFVGGNYLPYECLAGGEEYITTKDKDEKYFRPSNLPIMNNKEVVNKLIDSEYDKEYSNITIPSDILKTPEATILNYFSLLREAANPVEGKNIGCGSLGMGNIPYKIGYNFFTNEYKDKVSFKNYKKSFENIAHINLLKLKEVPSSNENELKYFFEIETIEGSDKDVAYFAYYYGYIYISKVNNTYKISNIDIYGENYLCTPYHGWSNYGESSVEAKYGNWCKMIKTMGKSEVNGDEKRVYFDGIDNKEYMILFYTLTNDNDIEIAQYVRSQEGASWVNIELNPNKCIENNEAKS
ncbi:hypothetical protein KPL40_08915 [Clostridium gasigenes]|uniref:hypothetical protein n=1 Tax=Clostridium gasigenes TaxID=94869 RepID=UPI001C0E352E|nr:hypothetical protein [Clostridium gasigenes]MBU3132577.1 hypothetical protein [Clostridium gasigenes]